MFYVAHRLFAAHDRALGAMIAQQLGAAVGTDGVFLPFCDTGEEDLVADVKGRQLFELDRQRLASLDGMLAVLHFPDALVQAVVTEIVRVEHLAPVVEAGTRFEVFRDRNLGQLATAVRFAVDRLIEHARSSSEHNPAESIESSKASPLAVCEPSPYGVDNDWTRIIQLLENRGYRVHQSQRFGTADPLVAAYRDWRALLGCQLLVVHTTGPETPCGAAVMIGGAAALARRIIAWHQTSSWTFARGREPNRRNLMIQYSTYARISEVRSLEALI